MKKKLNYLYFFAAVVLGMVTMMAGLRELIYRGSMLADGVLRWLVAPSLLLCGLLFVVAAAVLAVLYYIEDTYVDIDIKSNYDEY